MWWGRRARCQSSLKGSDACKRSATERSIIGLDTTSRLARFMTDEAEPYDPRGIANRETERRMAADPIHQFNIDKIFTIGHIGGQEIAFTNSSVYMFASVAIISLLMIGGTAGRPPVSYTHL